MENVSAVAAKQYTLEEHVYDAAVFGYPLHEVTLVTVVSKSVGVLDKLDSFRASECQSLPYLLGLVPRTYTQGWAMLQDAERGHKKNKDQQAAYITHINSKKQDGALPPSFQDAPLSSSLRGFRAAQAQVGEYWRKRHDASIAVMLADAVGGTVHVGGSMVPYSGRSAVLYVSEGSAKILTPLDLFAVRGYSCHNYNLALGTFAKASTLAGKIVPARLLLAILLAAAIASESA
jgi:hypothetical protein